MSCCYTILLQCHLTTQAMIKEALIIQDNLNPHNANGILLCKCAQFSISRDLWHVKSGRALPNSVFQDRVCPVGTLHLLQVACRFMILFRMTLIPVQDQLLGRELLLKWTWTGWLITHDLVENIVRTHSIMRILTAINTFEQLTGNKGSTIFFISVQLWDSKSVKYIQTF